MSHSLDLLNTYLGRIYVFTLIVREKAYCIILLYQMSIVLNEVQQDTIILLRCSRVIVLDSTFGIEYSSICVKSLPFNSNILGQEIASIDVFVYHVDIMSKGRFRTVQVKVVLHDTNKGLQILLLVLIELACYQRQVLLLSFTRKPRIEGRLWYVKA